MHELGITQSALDIVLQEAERIGASRVVRVFLKVGEWSSIEPDCVAFYFSILSRGTCAEGAELVIQRVPVTYQCQDCGFEYMPLAGMFSCPNCGSFKGRLCTGRELYVDSIEVENESRSGQKDSGSE